MLIATNGISHLYNQGVKIYTISINMESASILWESIPQDFEVCLWELVLIQSNVLM